MRSIVYLLLIASIATFTSCKANKESSATATTEPKLEQQENPVPDNGELIATIDGKAWTAQGIEVGQLAKFLVIKTADTDGRSLTLTLPYDLAEQRYDIKDGGLATVTWAVSRAEGWNFKAPYSSGVDGNITVTELTDTQVLGTFKSMVSNSGREIEVSGTFMVDKK